MMCRVVHETRMATRHWRFADEDVDAEVYGDDVIQSPRSPFIVMFRVH